VGVLNVPYYSSKAAPLTEYWHAPPFPLDTTSTFVTRFNPLPVPTVTLQIPVLVSVPNAASALGAVSPAAGWPVLVFQHGITRNREDLFGVADSFADSGFVVVAVDLPLHGITNQADPLYASGANPLYAGLGCRERLHRAHLRSCNRGGDRSFRFALYQPVESSDLARQPARGVADLITLARSLPA